MSRKIGAALARLVRGLTLPLGARQRQRVVARVIERLEQDGIAELACARGSLRMLRLRSAHCASVAERFFQDEPETLSWIDGFGEGEVLLDVGANIGSFSMYAALDPSITVIAVEPNGINFGLLVEHLALNELGERVLPFCVALGRENGIERLHMSQLDAGAAGASLGDAYSAVRRAPVVFSQAMMTFTIDSMLEHFELPQPTHIKLDVDGTEQDIIAGADKTLRAVRSVMVEIEERGDRDVEHALLAPLAEAGLAENVTATAGGSGRNRLFVRS